MHKQKIKTNNKKVKPFGHLEIFERAAIVDRWQRFERVGGGLRGDIRSFSKASKERLKFKAGNAFPPLISQFAMTYHDRLPQGRQLKKDLDIFLKRLRYEWKCGYLWILEFQTRKAPHLHLFLTLAYDKEGLREWLAKTWNEIVEPDNEKHFNVHLHAKNFIAWDMGSGAYLCKYLGKQAQKEVPEGFEGVGRFWGCSRGLVPKPMVITRDSIMENYQDPDAEKLIIRSMYRHHEKELKRYNKKSGARAAQGRFKLSNGGHVFEKCVEYLDRKKINAWQLREGLNGILKSE